MAPLGCRGVRHLGIVYEFLRVATHPRVFAKPTTAAQAWRFTDALLAAPGLNLLVETDRHAAVASDVLASMPEASGNLIHDLHTAVLMREHGMQRIVTRDSDVHRFGFLVVQDPLRFAD